MEEFESLDSRMRGGTLDREFNDMSALDIFSKLGWKVSTVKPGPKDTRVSSEGIPMALRLLEKSKKRKLE